MRHCSLKIYVASHALEEYVQWLLGSNAGSSEPVLNSPVTRIPGHQSQGVPVSVPGLTIQDDPSSPKVYV